MANKEYDLFNPPPLTCAEMNEQHLTELDRATLTGACGTCKRAASDCVSEAGKFACRGWLADEKKIKGVLADENT
jgi:hypothetical protein